MSMGPTVAEFQQLERHADEWKARAEKAEAERDAAVARYDDFRAAHTSEREAIADEETAAVTRDLATAQAHALELRAALERVSDAVINDENLHETDDDGEICTGNDGDGCKCELVVLINTTLSRERVPQDALREFGAEVAHRVLHAKHPFDAQAIVDAVLKGAE